MLFRRTRSGDVVIAKTNPPMLSVMAAPIPWRRGARLINWLQDIFPEVAQTQGIGAGRLGGFSFWLLKALRDASLRRADINVVLGDRMAKRVAARSVRISTIRVIPNWADGRHIHPIDPQCSALRKEWGLAGAFVVGQSGNLGRAHDIKTFPHAIERLEEAQRRDRLDRRESRDYAAVEAGNLPSPPGRPTDRQPDALARDRAPSIWRLFVGGGALPERLRVETERRGLGSVQFRPYQPRERLSETLGAADVHLISLRPDLEGLIVPSKYYGIAAAGRPAIFVGDSEGEIGGLLLESGSGTVVPNGDGAVLFPRRV